MARILLVDDERSIRLTLRVFLENVGHAVALAEDAEQAMVLLEKEHFDILITDIILPGLSGVELVRSLREKDIRLQIIMLTGQPTVETASESVRAGAMHYITKPVSRAALLRVVNQALRLVSIEEERRRQEEGPVTGGDATAEDMVAEESPADTEAVQSPGDPVQLSTLGQLTGSLAEEFGGFVHQMHSELQLLLKDGALKDTARVRGRLKSMASLVRRARQVVWKTRGMSHPPETLRLRRVDVSRLLPEVLERVQKEHQAVLAEPDLLRLEHSPAEGPSEVHADEALLRSVLEQLVLNALQAMPKGGVLEWSLRQAGGTTTLTLKDLGVGMNTETLERCFDLFFSTRQDGSPGIGLALARDAMSAHGGTIRVESQPEEGTTVTLRFPDSPVEGRTTRSPGAK
ncbi:MAG: response regulator [Verrucomicrobiales bacterium]|nr:response regulator [Verrucomicrobiales bacterium]